MIDLHGSNLYKSPDDQSKLLAKVKNPDVAGVHNENDLNMLTQHR
jgi:hypothetical protein